MITLQCGDFFPLCPHLLETLPKVRTAEKDKKKYQRKKKKKSVNIFGYYVY
jgi:hypothetical protein